MNPIEVWSKVNGLDEGYEVSNLGRVRSLKGGKERLVGARGSGGYFVLSESRNGVACQHYVHRLVAMAFIPRKEGRDCVNHIDGKRDNNVVTNLEWVNHSENMAHASKTGLMRTGEERADTKISTSTLDEIANDIKSGIFTQKQIAQKYGISKSVVSAMCNGRYRRDGKPVLEGRHRRINAVYSGSGVLCKLSDETIEKIRSEHSAGVAQIELSRRFGITPAYVHCIVHNKVRSLRKLRGCAGG